ncbi:trigger factor [Chloroflexota bacterium]
MKVTREKTENCQAFLTVEMKPAEVDGSMNKAYRHLAGEVKIPGFRKGKAPQQVIERYLGRASVLDEALKYLLPEAYENVIKEQGIEPVARPEIEIVQMEPSVIFKAVVPLHPEVKLGDYHDIKVEPESALVTEDNIDAVIEELRHQHATWEPVVHPVNYGDMTIIDVASNIDGEPFINKQGVQYLVVSEAIAPLRGFAEQLAGMKKGEEKEFNLPVPEDYSQKELAGKEASFMVKVLEVKEERLPELNDDFAKQMNPDFATLKTLREQVSTSLKERAEEKSRMDFEGKVVEAAVERAQVEFPPILGEAEIDRLIEEQSRRLQMDEKALEQYLKTINKTQEQLREELRPVAVKRVTNSVVLAKIAEEEKIEAGDADIYAEIEKMTADAQMENKDELRKFLNHEHSRESIRQMLLTRKTIERLGEIAVSTKKGKGKKKEAAK